MSRSFLIEAVEPRRLMSVVPVLNTNDLGPGSLRQAVIDAAPGDTVDLTALSGQITLATGPLGTTRNVTLLGPGADVLKLVGGGSDPVILNINGMLKVQGLTLTGGESLSSNGGGIFNRGSLELYDVTVRDNHAFLYGGGIFSNGGDVTIDSCSFLNNVVSGALEASGGALHMDGGRLTIRNSTFANNRAIGASNTGVIASGPGLGGGLYLHGTLDSTITNSTFGNNSAEGGTGSLLSTSGTAFGGAVYADTPNGTLLNHVTIAYNAASGGGPSLLKANSQGGGVYSTGGGVVTLKDSIAALNSAMNQPDVVNSLLNTLGNNLVGVFTGNALLNGILGDRIGTLLAPYRPGIATALAANGGETMTFALMPDSPAVNHGSVDSPLLDQRGLGRRDTADIGAFELNPNHLPVVVANPGAPIAGVAFSQSIGIADADADAVTVTSPNLPSWLKLRQIDGVWTLVGKPSELDAGARSIQLDVNDGFQTASTSLKLKVGIPGIDLSDTGLLRLNGTEFDDELSVTLVGDDTVRVFRDGFKRNFPLASIKKVQIFGFAGRDTITVDIGKIRATIFAGADNDKVQGGAGADYISGGMGDDTLMGGNGADRVDGDEGRDRVYGQVGDDTLHGNAGRDIIDGGTGRNRLFGDDGDDTFYSLEGLRDIIYGGAGNNTGFWTKEDTVLDAIAAK